jgi:hypothetical protein
VFLYGRSGRASIPCWAAALLNDRVFDHGGADFAERTSYARSDMENPYILLFLLGC